MSPACEPRCQACPAPALLSRPGPRRSASCSARRLSRTRAVQPVPVSAAASAAPVRASRRGGGAGDQAAPLPLPGVQACQPSTLPPRAPPAPISYLRLCLARGTAPWRRSGRGRHPSGRAAARRPLPPTRMPPVCMARHPTRVSAPGRPRRLWPPRPHSPTAAHTAPGLQRGMAAARLRSAPWPIGEGLCPAARGLNKRKWIASVVATPAGRPTWRSAPWLERNRRFAVAAQQATPGRVKEQGAAILRP